MQAFTAAPHHDVLVLLVQITLLLACARLLGELAQRFGQPTVVGEILAGIVLGPSLLSGFFPAVGHWIVPQTPESGHLLEVVSLFGAMFLLLLTGLETDVRLIRRHSRTALAASAGGIIVPFATGFLLGQYLPGALLAKPGERLVFALFLATAMSISAIPVIAKVLLDLNLMRRDIGQTIIAAGMADDAVGWMLLSVVVGMARSGELEPGAVAWSVGKVVLFMVVSFTAARWLVARTVAVVQDRMGSHFRILSAVVVLTFAWGAVAQALGLEAMLGAFVMGILLGQLPRLPHRVPEQIEQMAIGIFAPIFFAVAGLKVNARSLLEPRLIVITLIVILVASFGKVVGGYCATRFFTRCDHWTALSFGVGLNARGAMEIIIASIGLGLGILSQEMFSVIVVMAITTSVMAPPLLRWTLSHIRPGEKEMRRLEREEAPRPACWARCGGCWCPCAACPTSAGPS
jgi:Kef-type K+ transport system membrane component KefB